MSDIKLGNKILVTSALPYVNNVPHLGNLIGSVLSADAFARFMRINGKEVLFVLGTDEHGTTTEVRAMEEGLTPKELVDKYFVIHKNIYDWFETSYDCLGRTSSEANAKITIDIFNDLYKNGFIIENTITQLYSEKSKKFLSDRFVEGECPFCHALGARGDQCDSCGKLLEPNELINPVSKIDGTKPILKETKHLYIDLPKIEPDLMKWYNTTKSKWSNVAVGITEHWLKQGLKERCITRDLEWGIKVPLEGWDNKVFYSWFDAPIGYIGITIESIGDEWKNWWMNQDVTLYQFMGKDNVPFHAIMFPAFLIGTKKDYKLVNYLASTDYLNYEDKKFSKSKNIGVFGNDAKETGICADVWRYYLFRVRPETGDTQFVWDDFGSKVNNELVGNFGNFINRVVSLDEKFFELKKPKGSKKELIESVKPLIEEYKNLFTEARIRDALIKANEISALGNKYLQDKQPWITIKTDEALAAATIAECIDFSKLLAVIYYPFVPKGSEKIWQMLGEKENIVNVGINGAFSGVREETKLTKVGILFEKLEQKSIEEFKQKFSGERK
ncbi:MAG: methionine--tRNA ligase [Candidatus Diapherotrites archaeon]|uniref:Methionine--tRNA ligase n=1 Tax=Candidatus Iainarchaeum sp. TaxID=3101447 RepID=A0A7K4BYL1_9ARCH|nr:methionine--tRNA ligase [Candidatus Diapherotrites archaeon]